jgi:putative hydrolase of the HAD superfamily
VGDGGSRELTGAAAVGMTAVRLDAADLSRSLWSSIKDRAKFTGPSVRS